MTDVVVLSDGNIRKKEDEKLEIPRAEGRAGADVGCEGSSGANSDQSQTFTFTILNTTYTSTFHLQFGLSY